MNGWEILIPGFCGMGLHLKMDGFRMVYTAIAVLMWGVAGVFSREYMAHYKNKARYYIFFWATFLATVGVFLSADLYTTFIFFEIMSFTSYVWVAFDERAESLRAAETYLAVAVIGGMVMLMGLFLLHDVLGTLDMDEIGPAARAVLAGRETFESGQAVHVAGGFGSAKAQLYVAGGLMLFGFGAKAGCFPLHIWLPKAHPVAPAPASALLSGILTKAGVFGRDTGVLRYVWERRGVGAADRGAWPCDHVFGGAFGGIFRELKADPGLLFRVPDRLYHDRYRHVLSSGLGRGGQSPGSAGGVFAHGKPLPD